MSFIKVVGTEKVIQINSSYDKLKLKKVVQETVSSKSLSDIKAAGKLHQTGLFIFACSLDTSVFRI